MYVSVCLIKARRVVRPLTGNCSKVQVFKGHHTSVQGVIIRTTGKTGNKMTASQRLQERCDWWFWLTREQVIGVNLTLNWARAVWWATCCGNTEELWEWEVVQSEWKTDGWRLRRSGEKDAWGHSYVCHVWTVRWHKKWQNIRNNPLIFQLGPSSAIIKGVPEVWEYYQNCFYYATF